MSQERRGILLAGGQGTRLHPLTLGISKQLLPIYDKPMVYYPLSTLMLGGIKEVLVISTPEDLPIFERLLGDGSRLGIRISYKAQPEAGGIAQALVLGEEFLGGSDVALILGDNVFFGHGLTGLLQSASGASEATVFAYQVKDPERYGVVTFDAKGLAESLEEKPANPRSRYALTGLYFYPNDAVQIAKRLAPSERGELEITDVNVHYLNEGLLRVEKLGRGFAWLDTGTEESLLQASNFIATIEARQGFKIACIEEVALRMGFIDRQAALEMGSQMKNPYGEYLVQLSKEDDLSLTY